MTIIFGYLLRIQINSARTAITISFLALAELIMIFYVFHSTTKISRALYTKNPPTADFLREHPGRLLPLFVDDWDDQAYRIFLNTVPPLADGRYTFSLNLPSYWPNTNLLHGVSTIEINDPLLNINMGRFMALLGVRQLVTDGGEAKLNKLYLVKNDQDVSSQERFRFLKERVSLLDFLGVRYLFTFFPFDNKDIKPLRFSFPYMGEWHLNLIGPNGTKDSLPIPISFYENPTAKPILYFSLIDGFVENGEEAYNKFKESRFGKVFVECATCSRGDFSFNGHPEILKQENGYIMANIPAGSERFLIFTQNYLPGWRAFIDGKEVMMHRVNSVFSGIFVPAGEHRAEFKYDYWSLLNLKTLTHTR